MVKQHRSKSGTWPKIGHALATYGTGQWGLPDYRASMEIPPPLPEPYRCSYCGNVPSRRTLILRGHQWFCKATKACEARGRWDVQNWREETKSPASRRVPQDSQQGRGLVPPRSSQEREGD